MSRSIGDDASIAAISAPRIADMTHAKTASTPVKLAWYSNSLHSPANWRPISLGAGKITAGTFQTFVQACHPVRNAAAVNTGNAIVRVRSRDAELLLRMGADPSGLV